MNVVLSWSGGVGVWVREQIIDWESELGGGVGRGKDMVILGGEILAFPNLRS